MDKFEKNSDGGGARYSNGNEEIYQYNSRGSRSGGSPFRGHRQENYRGGEGGGNVGFHGGGAPNFFGFGPGRGSGSGDMQNHRAFVNSSRDYLPLSPGMGSRPIGERIGGFLTAEGGMRGEEGFGPLAHSEDGFRPMGGGGTGSFRSFHADGEVSRSMAGNGGDVGPLRMFDRGGFRHSGGGGFQPIGVNISDGVGFQPMRGGGSDSRRFCLDNHHIPAPSLSGHKREFPLSGGERSPDSRGIFVKLFVGSVPRTATEDDIRPPFENHGHVLEVAVIRDKKTGQHQGCCFIKYASPEEANRAIRALHNQYTMPGGVGPIQVRYADGERERLGTTEYKLFVGSLNKQATETEVEEIFSHYGRVDDVYLMRDEMKHSRGCGFVKYSQREMALAAINALNGTYTMKGCNQPLTVRFADPKRPRYGETRGGPSPCSPGRISSLSGPGMRPPSSETLSGTIPPDSWTQPSPHTAGLLPHIRQHGFSDEFPNRSGDIAVTSATAYHSKLAGVAVSSASMQQMTSSETPPVNSSIHPVLQSPRSQQHFQSNAPSFSSIQGIHASHKQSGHRQAPFAGGQAQAPFAGGQAQAPFAGGQAQAPFAGGQAQAPFAGGQAQAPFAGGQAQAPFAGGQAQALLAGGQAQAPLAGGQAQAPLAGGQAQAPLAGGQAQAPLAGGQAPYHEVLLSQQFQGYNWRLPALQNLVQQNTPAPRETAGTANQQPISQQIQPLGRSPSEMAEMLSQQKEKLQATLRTSQQALNQLQQQVQQLQPVNQNLVSNQEQLTRSKQALPIIQSIQSTRDMATPISASPTVPAANSAFSGVNSNWTEHTSPDGYKYYYNSFTGESKWERPEELVPYHQDHHQRQQMTPSGQHSENAYHSRGLSMQKVPQMQLNFHGQQQPLVQKQTKSVQPLIPERTAKQGSSELGYVRTDLVGHHPLQHHNGI